MTVYRYSEKMMSSGMVCFSLTVQHIYFLYRVLLNVLLLKLTFRISHDEI